MQAEPQQQRRDLLALGALVTHRRTAGAGEVAHRLVVRVRHPHRGQIAGAQLPGQRQRIPPIGLHPIAGLVRDQRRRHHDAVVAQVLDLPIQPVAGRSGFIGERQRGVFLCQPARQLRGRGRRVVDLAEIADLAVPSCLCDRHRVPQLRCVQCDVGNAMIVHGSPSLLEALPGPPGQPSHRIEGGPPPQDRDIRSSLRSQ